MDPSISTADPITPHPRAPAWLFPPGVSLPGLSSSSWAAYRDWPSDVSISHARAISQYLALLVAFFSLRVAGGSTLCNARRCTVHRPVDKSSNPSAAVSFPIPWLPAALSLHRGPLEMHPGVDRACVLTCRVQQTISARFVASFFAPSTSVSHKQHQQPSSTITCWPRRRHLLQLRCHAVPGASGFIGSQFPGYGRSHLKPAVDALIESTG